MQGSGCSSGGLGGSVVMTTVGVESSSQGLIRSFKDPGSNKASTGMRTLSTHISWGMTRG